MLINELESRESLYAEKRTLQSEQHRRVFCRSFSNISEHLLHEIKLIRLEKSDGLTDWTLEHKWSLRGKGISFDSINESIDVSVLLCSRNKSATNSRICELSNRVSRDKPVELLCEFISCNLFSSNCKVLGFDKCSRQSGVKI